MASVRFRGLSAPKNAYSAVACCPYCAMLRALSGAFFVSMLLYMTDVNELQNFLKFCF